MTRKRVQQAAYIRGIYFDGVKKWLNSCVGYGYEVYSPSGRQFYQADSLSGIYSFIMKHDKIA